MISRRILAAVALLCAITSAQAQPFTKSQLNSQIGVNFPDNSTFQITPQNERTIADNIVNSIMPTAPVVSGNLACFNGTTGLLQDCGVAPSATNIIVGTTAITGGSTGRVVFDNGGKVGEYTNAQLTAQINPATASLPGSLPAWPNNTTTVLRGDGTYTGINFAMLPAGTSDTALGYWGSTVVSALPIGNCLNALTYSTSTHAFGCNTSAGTGTVTNVGSGTGLTGGPITASGSLAIDFTGNYTWSGNNSYSAGAFFGGKPWFDVLNAAHGCAAADPTGVVDSTTAIQCHINFMGSNGGGIVNIPQGNYLLSGGGVIVPAAVWLEGAGAHNNGGTTLFTNTDSTLVQFAISSGTCPSGNHYGGMEKIGVFGFSGATPANATVLIGALCNVTLRDDIIWFGKYGLFNNGVDSHIESSFIWGSTAAVSDQGTNFYIRVKMDQPGATSGVDAFFKGAPVSGLPFAETHIIMSDMSGTYTHALNFQDGTNTSITTISESVFGAPVLIQTSRMVMFTANEFGSTSFTINNGNTNIVGSYGAGGTITIAGSGGKSCGGNTAIGTGPATC